MSKSGKSVKPMEFTTGTSIHLTAKSVKFIVDRKKTRKFEKYKQVVVEDLVVYRFSGDGAEILGYAQHPQTREKILVFCQCDYEWDDETMKPIGVYREDLERTEWQMIFGWMPIISKETENSQKDSQKG